MKKQKRNNANGITLIALVISIIVMLILAGVSINALVGDNGVLTQTQYASFLNEMSAVEEAVGLWKAGKTIEDYGSESNAIPTKGICKVAELTAIERLLGEIGYYRNWCIDDKMPSVDINTNATDFNDAFSDELVFYPAGVQDLYYLDTSSIGIDGNRDYLIDASTGLIYSTKGIAIKGVRVYSSFMAKAIMTGNIEKPLFAASEVSGAGNNIVYAGAEYLKNKDGQYIDENGNIVNEANKVVNPNGFQIIADPTSNNIYKLYNNGDLYAKGIKGSALSTPVTDMNKISNSNWVEFTVPSEIGSYKKIIQGSGTMFVIDSNDELWAWGSNSSNKLGLTSDQQKSYTGRNPIKLNVDNKKVQKVWDCGNCMFVLAEGNTADQSILYGMGYNTAYQLGLGHNSEVSTFTPITVPNPKNITNIIKSGESYFTIICYSDNTFYAAGSQAYVVTGNGAGGTYKMFAPILDGYIYTTTEDSYTKNTSYTYNANIDIDGNIIDICVTDAGGAIVLKSDNSAWRLGYGGWNSRELPYVPSLRQYTAFGNNVKAIYGAGYGALFELNNGKIYGSNGTGNDVGATETTKINVEITLPIELIKSDTDTTKGIKEIYYSSGVAYYLSNSGKLFASSTNGANLGKDSAPNGIIELEGAPSIETFYPSTSILDKIPTSRAHFANIKLFLGTDGKLYSINNSTVLYRNDILQKSWVKIASSVKMASPGGTAIAYVDNTNNLFVAGEDSRGLGLNTDIQTKIPNFVPVNDSSIANKVKSVKIVSANIYVLTTENKLYCSGLFSADGTTGWPNDYVPGWEELENKYTFYKILDDVQIFYGTGNDHMAVTLKDNVAKLWTWGNNNFGALTQTTRKPTELDLSTLVNVKNIIQISGSINMLSMISSDSGLYTSGDPYYAATQGAVLTGSGWQDRSSFLNGKIPKTLVHYGSNAAMILTEDNELYGWGFKKYLGLNDSSETNMLKVATKLPIENVTQIVAGNGFFIAVKEDGTVWGTGNNAYGILGRWAGSPRGDRYRTAFEWVECPDLEI